MPKHYLYLPLSLGLALPLVACELPESVVGETADTGDQPPGTTGPMDPTDPTTSLEPTGSTDTTDATDATDTTDTTNATDATDTTDTTGVPPVDPPTEEPSVLVTGRAGTLAVDATWLYIGGATRVPLRVVKSGGEVEPIVADDAIDPALVGDEDYVALITHDDSHVYWTAWTGKGSLYRVLRASKQGGAPLLVTDSEAPAQAVPTRIVVDDEFVYLAYPDVYGGVGGVLRRVPKVGGPALDLAEVFTYVLAVSDSYVYWPRPVGLGGSELVRADKDGGNVEVVAEELGSIYDVQVAGDRLYWSTFDADQYIARTALEGGAPTTLLAESGEQFYFGTPAVTADGIHWLRPGGADSGGVLSVDLEGNFSELATAPASPKTGMFYNLYGTRIAADESAAYWSYEGAQGGLPRIYRVAR